MGFPGRDATVGPAQACADRTPVAGSGEEFVQGCVAVAVLITERHDVCEHEVFDALFQRQGGGHVGLHHVLPAHGTTGREASDIAIGTVSPELRGRGKFVAGDEYGQVRGVLLHGPVPVFLSAENLEADKCRDAFC